MPPCSSAAFEAWYCGNDHWHQPGLLPHLVTSAVKEGFVVLTRIRQQCGGRHLPTLSRSPLASISTKHPMVPSYCGRSTGQLVSWSSWQGCCPGPPQVLQPMAYSSAAFSVFCMTSVGVQVATQQRIGEIVGARNVCRLLSSVASAGIEAFALFVDVSGL